MSACPDKRLTCLGARPKVPQWVRTPTSDLGPTPETLGGRVPHKRPAAWEHRQKAPGRAATGSVAAGPCAQTQSRGSATNRSPKRRSATQPDQRPGCLQAITAKSTCSEKLLRSPYAQNSAGPTGSLGGRQNTQQRGGAGLGETAFPGKTRPSRGLNYPIAALRVPSI